MFVRQLCSAFRLKRNRDKQYEFLPSYLELIERPPSPTARVTAVVVSLLVLFALVWCYFGQLDIHVTAIGQLTLPSRSQLIQAYETSEVVEILAFNGKRVKAGDKLLVLNVVGVTQEMRCCKEQLSWQRLQVEHYQALLSGHPMQTLVTLNGTEACVPIKSCSYLAIAWQEYQAILAKFDAELALNQSKQIASQTILDELQKLQRNIQKRLVPDRKLAVAGFLAKIKLLEKEKEALEIARSIAAQRSEIQILEARSHLLKKNRISWISTKYLEWQHSLNKAEVALRIATQELAKLEERDRLQTLLAPLDGVVQQLAVHTIGGIVQGAKVLMIITPYDAPQQAEIDIANKNVGFVHIGQRVTVKIEAFPFSRYGTVNGKVVSISRDSVKRNKHSDSGLVFPVQIELERNHIVINCNSVSLTPGMTVTAEIKTGQRRIIDFLLSPIRKYQAEACREP